MSETNFIFNDNTLTLYSIYGNQSIDQLLQGSYADVVGRMSESQKNQYNFWISSSESQRNSIINDINRIGDVVVSIKSYPIKYLQFPELGNLLSSGRVASYKVLTDEYMQFTDIDGKNYLVPGKYDPITNIILPR